MSNGLTLWKIHYGAFEANIIGISPDLVVHVAHAAPGTSLIALVAALFVLADAGMLIDRRLVTR